MSDYNAANAAIAAAFFTAHGYTAAQTAGILGNLRVESRLDPTASNTREGAIGIAQWEGGRRVALDAYAQKVGGSETDLMTQLGFLNYELQTNKSGAANALQQAKTPQQAAATFDELFEGSSGSTRQDRIDDAAGFFNASSGKVVINGADPSTLVQGVAPSLSKANPAAVAAAPYTAAAAQALPTPLPADAKTKLLGWITTYYSTPDHVKELGKLTDAQLVNLYVLELGVAGGTPVLQANEDWATELTSIVKWVLNPKSWERVGLGALGVLVIIAGFVFMFRQQIASGAHKAADVAVIA